MSYCVNCGVELAESEKKCPLCDTEVINPRRAQKAVNAPYPPFHSPNEQAMQKDGVILILSLFLLIPTVLTLLCDVSISHKITWSSYVLGACALLYIATIPPISFKHKIPILFVAFDTIGIAAYLFLIERMSGGHWFLTLGLPLLIGIAAILLVVLSLAMYTKTSRLKLSAATLIAVGVYTVWIEFFINLTFQLRHTFVWSLYPLCTFIVLGIILYVIDHNAPLKERLQRKFFI